MNVSFYDNLGYSYVAKFAMRNYDASGSELPAGVYRMSITDVIDNSTNKSLVGTGTVTDIADIDGQESIFVAYDTRTGEYLGYSTAPITASNPTNLDPDKKFNLDVKIPGMEDKDRTAPQNLNPIEVALDTSTMYDNNGTSTIYGAAGDYNGNYAGRKIGNMSGVAVQQDGKIYATYDNGTTKLLGQIAVASFSNPSGLEKIGENLYQTTMNSGQFDGIGKDVTSDGAGSFKTGVLEMSNVDLSQEFTEMITTQRGFQANSRIITVSDTMIEELTNLKR